MVAGWKLTPRNFNWQKAIQIYTVVTFGLVLTYETASFLDGPCVDISGKHSSSSQSPSVRDLLATLSDDQVPCLTTADCNNGVCTVEAVPGQPANASLRYCTCDKGYQNRDEAGEEDKSEVCSYKQKSGITTLLLSIFVGGCGVDWCFLSRGNCCYVCGGIGKGLTLGGLGIWSLVDIIRVATASFPDGNGVELTEI